MRRQPLTGPWSFRQVGADSWLPATVPGGVHTDLMRAGLIPDPFVGDNEKRVQWVAERDWEYRRTFTVGPEMLAEEYVDLVCDGLDTLAEVRLNGGLVAQTANQFCSYRWSLETLRGHSLLAGEVPVTVERFAASRVALLDFTDHVTEENRREVILVCELWKGKSVAGERQALRVVLFVPSKHLSLEDPQLTANVVAAGEQLTIEVTAHSLARFVELAVAGADVVFSDNYFDLLANRTCVVTCQLPHGWRQEQARDALRMRTLLDSYA